MATKKPRAYERLPGSGFLSQGRIPVAVLRSRLYLGADHLLRVENTRFQEKYRRFYFADIQSIVSVQTKAWLGWLAFWLGLVLCASPGIFLPLRGPAANPALLFFTGLPALFFTIFLVRAILRGRSCRTEILTPAGREIIPSLCRRRSTRRALEKILPALAQAQSALPPVLSADWQNALEQARQAPSPPLAAAPPPLQLAIPSPWLLWPAPVIAILAAAGFLAFPFTARGWFLVGALCLGVLALIPAIAALLRLPRRAAGLRGINTAIAIVSILIGITFYIEVVAASMRSVLRFGSVNQATGLVALASHPPFSPEAQLIITFSFAALTGLAGAAGLLSAFAFRRRVTPIPAAQP